MASMTARQHSSYISAHICHAPSILLRKLYSRTIYNPGDIALQVFYQLELFHWGGEKSCRTRSSPGTQVSLCRQCTRNKNESF